MQKGYTKQPIDTPIDRCTPTGNGLENIERRKERNAKKGGGISAGWTERCRGWIAEGMIMKNKKTYERFIVVGELWICR